MLLEVVRYENSEDGKATVGKLAVNGAPECFTLENAALAIPAGTYPLIIDQSPLFTVKETKKAGRPIMAYSPHILDVPGREGIRIHSGDTDADVEGCIAVGQIHPAQQDFIGSSRLAVEALVPKIEKALGLARVSGPPESRVHGENPPESVWHYEQTGSVEGVRITITESFLAT